MQDWDRLVMMGVGVAVSVYAGIDGYRLWRRKKYMAAVGVGILIFATIAVPVALALLAT